MTKTMTTTAMKTKAGVYDYTRRSSKSLAWTTSGRVPPRTASLIEHLKLQTRRIMLMNPSNDDDENAKSAAV